MAVALILFGGLFVLVLSIYRWSLVRIIDVRILGLFILRLHHAEYVYGV